MLYGRIVLIRALSATFLQPEGDQGPLAEAQRRAARGRLLAGEPGDRRDGRRDVDGGGVVAAPGRVSRGRGRCLAGMTEGARSPRVARQRLSIGRGSGRSCFRNSIQDWSK